jgi:hypothetical protein
MNDLLGRADQSLLSCFEEKHLLPFYEDELASDMRVRGFRRVAPQGRMATVEQFRAYPAISRLVAIVDRYLAKFEYGRNSYQEWQDLYVFPRKSALRSYTRRYLPATAERTDISDRIINTTPEGVLSWLESNVFASLESGNPHEGYPLILLTGAIGSGKSSFNKYITNVLFPEFQKRRVVTSRVEYRKFYNNLRDNGVFAERNEDALKAEIRLLLNGRAVHCLIRDLLHYCFTSQDKDGDVIFSACDSHQLQDLDLTKQAARDAFETYLENEDITGQSRDTIIESTIEFLARYRATSLQGRTAFLSRFLGRPATRLAALNYLSFSVSRGIRFYLILDGFDYIQAADFLGKTSHSVVLEVAASWIIRNRGAVQLSESMQIIHPMVQLTTRQCTYDYFWGEYCFAYGHVPASEFHIAAPEFSDVYNKIVERVRSLAHADDPSAGDQALEALLNRVQGGLQRELKLSRGRISSLFRQNVRHRINFVRSVFAQITRETIEASRGRSNLTGSYLLTKILEGVDDLAARKSYRLVEILLYAWGDRFTNFVDVSVVERWLDRSKPHSPPYVGELILRDNNHRTGYIGNVLNYHIPYNQYSDIHFFLEKYRILEILGGSGYADEARLLAEFGRRGWRASPYFSISLALLVREAMVKGVKSDYKDQYEIEDLGEIVKDCLFPQMGYLENIFFGCYWPGAIHRQVRDIVRSPARVREWVSASIYHMWILLRVIRTAELEGQQSAFERIYPSLLNAITAIVHGDAATRMPGDTPISAVALRHIRELEDALDAG